MGPFPHTESHMGYFSSSAGIIHVFKQEPEYGIFNLLDGPCWLYLPELWSGRLPCLYF